jgi:hypothetical protein
MTNEPREPQYGCGAALMAATIWIGAIVAAGIVCWWAWHR